MNRKHILATLTCLIMFSSMAGGLLSVGVKAQTLPTLKMYGIRVNNAGWGYFGGYWAIWEILIPELKKIGIDITVVDLDPFDFEAEFYDGWEVYGDPNGDGVRDGWDFATREWWLNPTSHIWFDEMVLSDHVPQWNVMPWMDEDADDLYLTAVTSLDPVTFEKDHTSYKTAMKFWQEEFMDNPPVIPMYYAEMITGQAAYIDGYDNTAWFYNPRELRVNQTTWNDIYANIPATRQAQGSNVIIVGMAESIAMWHPFYTVYYTEEMMNVLKMGMLYRNEREHQDFPTSGAFRVYPDLAADFPTWYTAETLYPGEYPEGYMVARIPIRDGVYWSDGVKFNATDVAFTLNTVIDKKAGSFARADYVGIYKEAKVVNELTVDIITYGPRYDLAEYFAHGWAIAMLPWHQFKAWGIDNWLTQWKVHMSNYDPIPESMGGQGLECLGPYVPVWSDTPTYPTQVELKRFDAYVAEHAPGTPWYWNSLTTPPDTDNPGQTWGWGLPENMLVKIIPDDTDRFLALRTLGADLIDYPLASVDDWGLLGAPLHKVYMDGTPYPASNPLWMNLNNPILSNPYVRLAIAHAIPYQTIYNTISQAWGLATIYPGKTFVTPWMEAYDPTIPSFAYDLAKAEQYMWMYWNSLDKNTRSGNDDPAVYSAGPMGDHDLNGLVELGDFPILMERFGTNPSNYYQYTYPYPATYPDIIDPHVYWPGNDIDPDNDNNDLVDLSDITLWVSRFGYSYP